MNRIGMVVVVLLAGALVVGAVTVVILAGRQPTVTPSSPPSTAVPTYSFLSLCPKTANPEIYSSVAVALKEPGRVCHIVQKEPLAVLPSSISQLKQLITLNLNSANLSSLPDEIGQLPQLRSLLLAGNTLQSIPPTIGGLQQLERLMLDANQITTLPETIKNLNNLRELSLRHNPLQPGEKERLQLLLPQTIIHF